MKRPLIEPLESRIAPATLGISPIVAGPEGDSGERPFAFLVTLSEAITAEVTVDFTTANGSATAGSDYTGRTGTLTFTAGGPLFQTINISVLGDTVGEDDETFTVTLSGATTGTTIDTAVGTGTIQNDARLTLTKSGDIFEGNSGTQNVTFTATLTEGPATTDVVANYIIVEAGATVADQDYVPVPAGTLTFTPGGATAQTVVVTVNGDTKQEFDESFDLRITTVTGATVVNNNLRATILTELLTVTQLPATVLEGSSGQSLVTYRVDLGDYDPANFPVKVSYATLSGGTDGTAASGSDFSSTSGVLTFLSNVPQTVAVPIYGDLLAEASETFSFRASFNQALQDPGITVPGFTRTVTTTIVNDDLAFSLADNAATLSATLGQAELNAGTSEMTFRVTLTGDLSAPVSVKYRTVNGTGNRGASAAAGDFVAEDDTLVFNPGDTEQTISITINGDLTAELSEAFTVELYEVIAGPGVTHSFARAVGTGIIKNDDVTVSIASLGPVAEGQSGLTQFGFRATITSPLAEAVTFSYSTANGTTDVLTRPLPTGTSPAVASTATVIGDYEAVTAGTITIPAGATSADFFIAVRGDTTREADEIFTVSLPANAADTVIGTGAVLGRIVNDDPFLSIGDVTVTEGTGGTATATFVVSLTLAPVAGERVEVKFSTGTSAVGVPATDTGTNRDYVPQTDQTLTFAVGETQKTITIDVVGDQRFEAAEEKFTVTLSDAKLIKTTGSPAETPYTIARAVGTATILDDDTPTVSITPTAQVRENSGAASFTVSLSNLSDLPLSVDYRTLDGTATVANGDYTAAALTTLTFTPGLLSQIVTVGAIGDTVNEPDETFQVQLSNAKIVGGAALTITAATGTGTILNDDRTVTLGNASLTETAGPMNFTVTLNGGASTSPVTVFYTTREGGAAPATSGSDFTARTGSVVIPAGSTSATIPIAILADAADELDQTFEVVISSVTNAVVATGGGVGTGTILDDDAAPTVQLVPTLSVNEGTAADATANFTVVLSQASEKVVTVAYSTTAGTAQAGPDFTTASGTLMIEAGLGSKTFPVTIKADPIAEANETFTATISAPTNATLGTTVTSTATIVNDDLAPTLSIADFSGRENAGSFTFAVTLSRAYSQVVTVQYTTVDSTALVGSDYTLTTGTLTFAANETSQTITVPILNNDGTAEPDERFLVRLSSPVNATLLDGEANGFIQNDDVAFTIADLTIAEEGAGNAAQTAQVVVTRTGTAAASIQYRTVDGTALSASGRDFTAQTGTLAFAAGQLSRTISIPIAVDAAYEFQEQFTVELFSPVDAVLADGTATVTINDNDVAPTLTATSTSFTEGATGNSLPFTVRLSAANEREDVTVQFETLDGTAVATGAFADFTAPAGGVGELRFARGETSKLASIAITNDARDEADETFTLRLKNANAAFAAGGATLDLTGTIVDNDATPTLSITNALTIAENESGAPGRVFTVQLSAASERPVTVNWRTAASTTGTLATAGVDYTTVPATLLTFAPGVTSQTFAVGIVDDALDEENERFDVVLENPTNATLGTARSSVVITDNDLGPVISIGDSSIVEGAAPAITFTVSLSAPSGRALTVNYATTDGTATSSGAFADFAAVTATTLIFAPGETSKTISIPIIDDIFREEVAVVANNDFTLEGERFTVTLSTPTNATLGDSSAAGLILNGSDTALGLVVAAAGVVESGANQTSQLVFNVLLSAPAIDAVSFTAATRNGTALAGVDYAAIAGIVSIPGTTTTTQNIEGVDTQVTSPGGTSAQITVNVIGDVVFEATESVFLDLTGFSGGVTADFESGDRVVARGAILNDDFQLLNNGRTAQWIDVDGDLVTLTTTRGSFTGLDTATFTDGTTNPDGTLVNRLWLQPTGTLGGRQLVLLSLLNLGGFAGASVSVTAEQQPGFNGLTDGHVNVTEIRAAQRVGGELDWVGVDLVNVTVEGDLGKITAGDNVSTQALRKLDVLSLGTRGTATNGSDIASEILGPVGTVLVRGDLGGQFKLIGQEFGRLGVLTIEGALRGGTLDGTGSVIVSGRVGTATIGEIVGGAGQRSGALLGNQNNNGTLGNVTVLGAITGGTGFQSAVVLGAQIGHVKVGSIVGGTGTNSALIFATLGNIASLTVEGAIAGGAADSSGQVFATQSIGRVNIGAITGSTGANSGQVFANVSIGAVKLGALTGGDGAASGTLGVTRSTATDTSGNAIFNLTRNISSLAVEESITGGGGDFSGNVSASVSLGTTTIGDDLRGGAGITSGSIFSQGTVGRVTIADDLIGGSGGESGILKVARLTTVIIGGDLVGGAGSDAGSIEGGSISSLSIAGPIIGGGGTLSGSVRFTVNAGKITVGENPGGQSVIGAAGLGSGRVAIGGDLGQIILAGDIAGGAGNFTGALIVGGDLDQATLRGSIIGGAAPATGAALQNSGFLQVGLLRSALLTGNLIAGTDAGAGNTNSGVIRTGRTVSLTIEGNVTGTASVPAIISGAASIDTSNVGLGSVLIKGNVSFAEILSGYDGNTTQSFRGNVSSADAQISKVEVRGSVAGLNIIAGAAPGADGRFGDATDVLGSGATVRDSTRVLSSIASVIFKGAVAANAASFGIVAQHVVSVKTGPTGVPLVGLARGAGNDLATAIPNASDLIATNFRAVEIPV